MHTIGDAAAAAGLPTKTVRYYADISLVAPQHRSDAGYRLYGNEEIRKLIFVKRARDFGFTIGVCRELLGLYSDQNRSSADVKRIAQTHIEEIDQKMKEMQLLRDELDGLVSACRGDNRPDCPIIEGFSALSLNR